MRQPGAVFPDSGELVGEDPFAACGGQRVVLLIQRLMFGADFRTDFCDVVSCGVSGYGVSPSSCHNLGSESLTVVPRDSAWQDLHEVGCPRRA